MQDGPVLDQYAAVAYINNGCDNPASQHGHILTFDGKYQI